MPCSAEQVCCDQRLVGAGKTKDEVRAMCGVPTEIHYFIAKRRKEDVKRSCPWERWGKSKEAKQRCKEYRERSRKRKLDAEEWTYDLGRERFIRRITFHEWWVVKVETFGYGGR